MSLGENARQVGALWRRERGTDRLLLYHLRLGSTRCWKPDDALEVAAGPTAMVEKAGDVSGEDELGEAGEAVRSVVAL